MSSEFLLHHLEAFAGPNWEQEDDVPLVSLIREPAGCVLASFEVPSAAGNERIVIDRVAAAVGGLRLAPRLLERLKTAAGEATMNAIEHGNQQRIDLRVQLRVIQSGDELVVSVMDAGAVAMPIPAIVQPDLESKLSGSEPSRGWGMFLIERMVDDVKVANDVYHHTVQLRLRLQ